MPHPLDDCRAKITRANEHLAALTRAVEDFLARDPYDLIQRDDPRTGEHVICVRVRENPPSATLAALVGDLAQNLRSALDYLSQRLVRANGQASSHATEFPIFLDASRYPSDAPRKTRGMSTAAMAVLERLQPFNGATPDRHPLWLLHELNNADKHRQLSVVGSALHSQALTVTGNLQVAVRPAVPVALGTPMPILPLRDGMELMRLAIVDRAAHGAVEAEGSFTFGISFEAPPIVRGLSVVPVMRSLTDCVSWIVESPDIGALFP